MNPAQWIEEEELLNAGNNLTFFFFLFICIITYIKCDCICLHNFFSNVETLPIFTRHLKDLRCCDGDSIRLECHVDGQPEPAIIWEKDGRVLPQCDDFLTNFVDGRATLSVRHIYPEDEGEYTCVAANNIGRAFSSACIVVDGKKIQGKHS